MARAGTVRADAGTILFDGDDVTGLPARQRCHRGIARSFQIPLPFVGMTTYENVLVGAAFGRRASERDSKAKAVEVLELTGLARRANTYASELTLLERKRLELARGWRTNSIGSQPRSAAVSSDRHASGQEL